MNVTLNDIKVQQAKISEMISAFERQPFRFEQPIVVTFPKLREGEKFAGVIISADGSKRERLILLPGDYQGDHAECIAWAHSIGGKLFDRTEGALLHASMNDEFKPEAYWTREVHPTDKSYAWFQYFIQWHPGLQRHRQQAARPGRPQRTHLTIQ